MSNVAYIVKESGVTLFKDGKQFSAPSDFWSYDRIINKIKTKDFDGIEALFNARDAMVEVQKEIARDIIDEASDVRIANGEVYIGERKIYNSVTKRLIKMMQSGFDVKPLSNFLKRLLKNPSKTAIEELYPFMEKADVAIDNDGFIIAYKKVKDNYFDIHSGTVNYNIGNIVEMPRNEVDDNRSNLCSDGLHFCSFSYLSQFGSDTGNRVLVVKVDPADVVSIPADYNDAKARTCRMEVIAEIKQSKVGVNEDVLAKAPVYTKSQSAPAQISPAVKESGKLQIVTFKYVDDYVEVSDFLSRKTGTVIEADFLAGISSLNPQTLKQLTAVYNDLVNVYNVIQSEDRVASVAMFKCSKDHAIEKILGISDKILDIYNQG